MPARTPPPPKDLDEVERALSVLEGRHPEHERIRRETAEAAETRRHQLESDLADGARRRRRRTVVLGANAVALVVAAVVGWRVWTRAQSLRAGLARVEVGFVAEGLVEVASNELSARSTLTFDAPGSVCFVAVTDGGDVQATEGAMTVRAGGSVGWCACDAGSVTLVGPEGHALALLKIDASRVGGPLARSWTSVQPGAWGNAGGECAESMLDGWIADRGGRGAVDEGWLASTPARATLSHAGFRAVGIVQPGRPFGVVDAAAGECILAVPEGPDELSLRVAGGQRRIAKAHGAMAWCSNAVETTSLWREGTSRVVLLAVPSAHVGGLLGVRECAEIAAVTVAPESTWLRNEDLAWDAASLLRASGIADAKPADVPSEPGPPMPDIVALARAPGASVTADPGDVVTACDPALDVAAERSVVCAGSAPVSWWRHGDAPAAMAHAPVPFWLSILQSHREPDAVARIPELLALARRLLRDGFEATVFEGVTELPEGVRVVGRAHEDAIVAVGLLPKAPWAVPYSDATPWDLGDTPRVVSLDPGLAVKLVAAQPPGVPPEKRRTVVFRHVKRP